MYSSDGLRDEIAFSTIIYKEKTVLKGSNYLSLGCVASPCCGTEQQRVSLMV